MRRTTGRVSSVSGSGCIHGDMLLRTACMNYAADVAMSLRFFGSLSCYAA